MALDFAASPESETIDFRGYRYTRRPSPISGALAIRYDASMPQIWRVPFRRRVEPTLTVRAPKGGYIVPPAYVELIGPRLEGHGIFFKLIPQTLVSVRLELFRASKVEFAAKPFEGRMIDSADNGEWDEEGRDIVAGSLYVPINQARARLLLALLEPRAPDSFASWGFFNAAFERKEFPHGGLRRRANCC